MQQILDRLWIATDDLLYRVRIYDRKLSYSEEILKMDEEHRRFGSLRTSEDKELVAYGVEKLKEMRFRLLTMMEDLLFTA